LAWDSWLCSKNGLNLTYHLALSRLNGMIVFSSCRTPLTPWACTVTGRKQRSRTSEPAQRLHQFRWKTSWFNQWSSSLTLAQMSCPAVHPPLKTRIGLANSKRPVGQSMEKQETVWIRNWDSTDVPAHNILQLCVNLSQGRCPAPYWKRPPGRPRNTWIQHVEEDHGCTIDSLWSSAQDRSLWRSLRPSLVKRSSEWVNESYLRVRCPSMFCSWSSTLHYVYYFSEYPYLISLLKPSLLRWWHSTFLLLFSTCS